MRSSTITKKGVSFSVTLDGSSISKRKNRPLICIFVTSDNLKNLVSQNVALTSPIVHSKSLFSMTTCFS